MKLILILLLVFSFSEIYCQCAPTAPSVAACSGGNGVASNGLNINSGETYFWSGSSVVWASGVNLNGGTLRICGSLTLSNLTFNSGLIVIESGGSLTINGSSDLFLNGNSAICNRGSLSINRNLRLQNANNTIWNIGTTATIVLNGFIELNSSTSKLINDGGSFQSQSILFQSSAAVGSVCATNFSCFNFTSPANGIINNLLNGWVFSGSGNATIVYSGNAQLNQNLTSSSNYLICKGASATTSGGAGWGAATVFSNCTSCLIALPVSIYDVSYENLMNEVFISWQVGESDLFSSYELYLSNDGLSFQRFAETSNQEIIVSKENIPAPFQNDILYFKVKAIGNDSYTFSEIVAVNLIGSSTVYSSLISDNFMIKSPNNSTEFSLCNSTGNIVLSGSLSKGNNYFETASIAKGIYFLTIHSLQTTQVFHCIKY